jgi:hypothetical protein
MAYGYPTAATDMSHVYMGIWIGGRGALQSGALLQAGIHHVINVGAELMHSRSIDWNELQYSGIAVQHVPLDDHVGQPLLPTIDGALQYLHSCVASGQPILVNCQMGVSRSTSVVMAYLIQYHGMSYEEAYGVVVAGRPMAYPNPSFDQQLRHLAMSTGKGHPGGPPPDVALGYMHPHAAMYADHEAPYRQRGSYGWGMRPMMYALRHF